MPQYDAVVVGSGPNGLAAAITLAREGLSVLVVEAASTIGGGTRTAALTLPGFVHDVCSAVHPFAVASPFLKSLPLAEHGLELIHPPAPLAHPFDDGTDGRAGTIGRGHRRSLGPDAPAYRRLIGPFVGAADALFADLIGPLEAAAASDPGGTVRLRAIQPATRLARSWFGDEPAKALLAGLAAHSILPLEFWATSAVGLVLGLAGHAVGWPIVRGGSQNLSDALASYLRSLGGEIVTGWRVRVARRAAAGPRRAPRRDTPPGRPDRRGSTPRGLRPTARTLPLRRRGLQARLGARAARSPGDRPDCARAGTVHLGGTLDEVAASEATVGRGEHPERPFVLLSQPSLFDPSRAPAGQHTAWAYCHVPNGSTVDMTGRIEAQVERFAPGFRDASWRGT